MKTQLNSTQLNSTKKNYILAVTSFLVMFLFLFSASPSSTLAQCPTDIAPTVGQPGYVAWTSFTRNFGITGTSCIASVQFCTRFVNGQWQTFIVSITPLTGYWGAGCDDLTWYDVINDIQEQVMKEPDAGPCSDPVKVVTSLFAGTCIKMTVTNNIPTCTFCPGQAYCKKVCDLCISGGVKTLQNCTTTTIGSSDCTPVSESTWKAWSVGGVRAGTWGGTLNVCFLVGCID